MEQSNVELQSGYKEAVEASAGRDEFEILFDDLISTAHITREVHLTKKITLELKPLTTEEYLEAESVYIATMVRVPLDVVAKARVVSTLAYATVAINGRPVAVGTPDEILVRREKLEAKLMKLPPDLIEKAHKEYLTLVEQQKGLLQEIEVNVENF